MSRSYNQSHPTAHCKKHRFPNPFKKRKMKPYGMLGWCGFGGEVYLKKFGEITIDIVSKKFARRKAKEEIKAQCNDMNENMINED